MDEQEQLTEHSMMEMLAVEPLGVRIRRILDGLKMPKDSGEYKYARFMILRIFGPSTVSFIVMTMILIGSFFIKAGGGGMPPPPEFEITMMTPETVEQKIEVEEDKPKEEIPPPEEVITENPDLAPGPPSPIETPGPPQEFSSNPDPSPNDNTAGVGGDMDTPLVPYAVVMTKSPVVIKGLYGNRTKGGRESALRAYGGGGGGGKVFPTEVCVLRALRWLKQKQQTDGTWKTTKPAMTGLALLAFLAHGETPASEEFGLTVEMAIRWLMENCNANGHFNQSDGHEYAQPIAAYALSEAYALTKVPDVKAAAEKAIYAIVEGQHASGGWNYNLNKEDRDDTSYMGWCAQALKAAHMAKLDVPNLEEAMKKGIEGFKKNFSGTYEKGGFGYCGGGMGGLTAVGALCMQYLGAAKSDQVSGALATMNDETWLKYNLEDPGLGNNGLYYWYYATQAKFNAGGEAWNKWNKIFSPELMKKQKILSKEESKYIDHKGRPQETGHWDQYKGNGANEGAEDYIFTTCLCVLQLEVYYRFLPTFKAGTVEDAAKKEEKKPAAPEKKKDDGLNISI